MNNENRPYITYNVDKTNKHLREPVLDEYEIETIRVLKRYGLQVKVTYLINDNYFPDDSKYNQYRDVYNVKISTTEKSFNLRFGNSMFNTEKLLLPSVYTIIACLRKREPYKEDMIDENGRFDPKGYSSALREYEAFSGLFEDSQIPEGISQIY